MGKKEKPHLQTLGMPINQYTEPPTPFPTQVPSHLATLGSLLAQLEDALPDLGLVQAT